MRRFLPAFVLFSALAARPVLALDWQSTVDSLVAAPALMIGVLALIGAAFGLYFLPSVIGIVKGKENVVAITVLNFFLGWTFIGWLVSLIWALTNSGCKKLNKDVAVPVLIFYVALSLVCAVPLTIGVFLIAQPHHTKAADSELDTQSTKSTSYSSINSGDGGAVNSGSSNSWSKSDPLEDLRKENADLVNQIGLLKGNCSDSDAATARLKQQLDDTRKVVGEQESNIKRLQESLRHAYENGYAKDRTINEMTRTVERLKQDRDAQIANLQNSLRIADENGQSKDRSIADAMRTLERWKHENDHSSVAENQKQMTFAAENHEVVDERWPNVQNFQPGSYKMDIERRLISTSADRKLSEFRMDVRIRFTIEKDGHPSNIELLTPIEDEETRKLCLRYIEAAGPFRPLISRDLTNLAVDAQLSQPDNARVQISSLQIAALGNRF